MDIFELLQARYPHVNFLLTAEAGSRAWGFESPDSDFDIRFVYAYKDPHEYIALSYPADVLEFKFTTEQGDLYEYAGWDIRKALFLAAKSNFALYEWLRSPIKYNAGHPKFVMDLNMYVENNYSFRDAASHYRGMAKQTFKDIKRKVGEKSLKRFLYVIRPLLCIEYMLAHKKMPPVRLSEVVRMISLDPAFIRAMDELIEIKMKHPEQHSVDPKMEAEFLVWMETMLNHFNHEYIQENFPHREPHFKTLNRIYKNHLGIEIGSQDQESSEEAA